MYYLAYALGQHGFALPERELWAVVTFTVLASVVAAAIYTANRDSVLVKKDADLAE